MFKFYNYVPGKPKLNALPNKVGGGGYGGGQ